MQSRARSSYAEPQPSKVQGECRAELARAMLSRSLYSPMQLVCIGKGTTF